MNHAKITSLLIAVPLVFLALTVSVVSANCNFVVLEYGAVHSRNDFAADVSAVSTTSPTTTFEEKAQDNLDKIQYGSLIANELTWLLLRNGLRLTDESTRDRLDGPFVEDWFDSVGTLWTRYRFHDNGKFLTNFAAHPAMGSTSAFIFRLSDPISLKAKFGRNSEYYRAKKRQFVFTLIDTILFEIGPISESSIGNIRQGWVDFIFTPTLGIAWSIGEDALRHYVLDPMYLKGNRHWANFLSIFLNPSRSFANVMAFRKPWSRE